MSRTGRKSKDPRLAALGIRFASSDVRAERMGRALVVASELAASKLRPTYRALAEPFGLTGAGMRAWLRRSQGPVEAQVFLAALRDQMFVRSVRSIVSDVEGRR